MLNTITIMGRITKDIELRQTGSGVPVTTFSVAVDRDYQPKDGDKIADFISVTAWRGLAEFCSKYLGKGRQVVVTGTLQSDKYTDKDGNNRTSWGVQADHIYFADSRRDGDEQFSPASDDDEDIPF